MQVSIWLISLGVILWLVVLILRAIRPDGGKLSPYELSRRAKTGDKDAARLEERALVLPRVVAFIAIIWVIMAVAAIGLTVWLYGALGALIAIVVWLAIEVLASSKSVRRLAHSLYEPREQSLLHLVTPWKFLDLFSTDHGSPDNPVATSKAELQYIVARSSEVLSHDERLRLQASFDFDNHAVEDIMTPISVVDVADVHDSLGPLVLDDLHKTGHSRFPVIDGDVHHVVGVLYLHDIVNLSKAKATVKDAMDPHVHYIHQNQTLEHALHGFLRTHRHLFIVVNDYRETVGVLTLEDVLETLFGQKIVDEFDKHEDLRAVAESNPKKYNLPKGKADI